MSIETVAELTSFVMVANGSESLLFCRSSIVYEVGRVIFDATFSTNSYPLFPAEITIEL